MEEQANLGKLEVGTEESEKTKLEPKKVKIVSWKVKPIEKAHADKVEFVVKHPDRDEEITISSVAYLDGKSVITSGTWLNLDKQGKIQKGSALAIFLQKVGFNNLDEAVEKETETELDDKGYLCFRAY